MSTMKCENVQDLIAEYRSDILDPGMQQAIEKHLTGCEDCRRELEEFDAVMELVDESILEQEPPVGLWNGVYNRISVPEPKRSVFDRLSVGWLRRPARALGFGGAVLALVAGLMFGTIKNQPNETLDQAASDNRYVQAHALTAGTAPFADHASYVSFVAMSQETPSGGKQ